MRERIIYQNETGGVSIFVPAPDLSMSIHDAAEIVVPTGLPYKIVDVADIPSDRQWRNEWTVDEADLVDGVGA